MSLGPSGSLWYASSSPSKRSSRHRVPCAVSAATATIESDLRNCVDDYERLGFHAGVRSAVSVQETPLGRGLVTGSDVGRQPLVSVPIENSLIIADEPVDSISIFSDRNHRLWQETHGELPPQLLEFLQGAGRWDVRMTAWLLWVAQQLAPSSPLWRSYLDMLPRESDTCCLLNFNPEELQELQVPRLQREAKAQVDWCVHLHERYLDHKTGELSALGLSSSLAFSLWAIAMVRSRTFSEDVGGELLTLMVPFADLANHSNDNNSTFNFSADRTRFELRSLCPLAKGTELTITYGEAKPNAHLLRDYGFIIPGNEWDRLDLSPTSSSSREPYGLNPVSFLEAAGFTGDLIEGSINPGKGLSSTHHDTLRWSRRRAALLSLPVAANSESQRAAAAWPGGNPHLRERDQVIRRGSGRGAAAAADGGCWLSWLDSAAKPWTPAGEAAPQRLQAGQVVAERVAVGELQRELLGQMGSLKTSIQTDEGLLAAAAAGEFSESGAGTSREGSTGGLFGSDRGEGGRGVGMSPRRVMAVAARLEHKLLLREALAVLQHYEHHLEDSTTLPS